MCGYCCFIPADTLRDLAKDEDFSAETRKGLLETARLDTQGRKLREQARKMTSLSQSLSSALRALAPAPKITVYDCAHAMTLPGTPIDAPARSADPTVRRTLDATNAVAKFYKSVFGRNSIDDAGMTMMSSVHYGANYNNAFWNGFQMTYGDGNGTIFIDFSLGDDVICHELTHGVTQYSLQLAYTNEAGGLNESLSDVFGSMFRQWRAGQDVASADWLIGKDIIGPQAAAKGYACLRDMANPAADHCLAPQPRLFKDFKPGMDPHTSSGIPNLAFCKAATRIGGKSWEKTGQIWYRAMTGFGTSPKLKMKTFADRTRQVASQLYPAEAATAAAIDSAWKAVGL